MAFSASYYDSEVNLKIERLFPSAIKPGVFYFEPTSASLWEEMTGVDFSVEDRFKYAIGTWTEVTRNNRGIKIYSNDKMDFIRLGEDAEPGEAKPNYFPDGYLENTEENAASIEPKPPQHSYEMWSGYRRYRQADYDVTDSDASQYSNYEVDGRKGMAHYDTNDNTIAVGYKNYDPMFAPERARNYTSQSAANNDPGFQHMHNIQNSNNERKQWLEGDFDGAKYEVYMPGAYIADSEGGLANIEPDARPGLGWSGY